MGSRASGHSRMSLNSRNNGCSTPASPVVVDVMATIDPLAPRTCAGVYEIFEPRSRIATRSLACAGLWSLLHHSWTRRFRNSRRGIRRAPGLAWGWRPPTPTSTSLAIRDVEVLARRLDMRRSQISAAAPTRRSHAIAYPPGGEIPSPKQILSWRAQDQAGRDEASLALGA